MPAEHLALGRQGEDEAVKLLSSLGYTILARNHRCRLGEVDIVCRHEGVIVFVEVKTRAQDSLGSGAEAVDRRKRSRIVKACADYLSANGLWDKPCRFDVVSVVRQGERLLAEHYPDGFQVEFEAGKGAKGWQPW
ncbi:MAG: YraN family protein [Desulfovibrio sp.]|nr:YraN family protein [Desulfovibrio sp.]MBI4960133.1 YraN family protein [Desulfovibrio sp.]